MRKAKQVTYPLMDYGMPRLPSFSLIVLLMLNGVAEQKSSYYYEKTIPFTLSNSDALFLAKRIE